MLQKCTHPLPPALRTQHSHTSHPWELFSQQQEPRVPASRATSPCWGEVQGAGGRSHRRHAGDREAGGQALCQLLWRQTS